MATEQYVGEKVEVEGQVLYKYNIYGHTFYWNTATLGGVMVDETTKDIRVYIRIGAAALAQIQSKAGIKKIHSTKGLRTDYAELRGIDIEKPLLVKTVPVVDAAVLEMDREWQAFDDKIQHPKSGKIPDRVTVVAHIMDSENNKATKDFLIKMYDAKYTREAAVADTSKKYQDF